MSLSLCKGFVTVASDRVEVLVEFYTRLFSQTPSREMPRTYAEYDLPGLRLAIFKPSASHQTEFLESGRETSVSGAMSLCLEVQDIYGAIAHLTAMGYPPLGPLMTTSHGLEIYGYDPDGNRLIFHQRPTG